MAERIGVTDDEVADVLEFIAILCRALAKAVRDENIAELYRPVPAKKDCVRSMMRRSRSLRSATRKR